MKTYLKDFIDLNDKERKSFLDLSEQDQDMPRILKGIEENGPIYIEVAFAREGRDSVVAVDYCVHDGYQLYTPVGYQEWGFENYDPDEEVEDEAHLPMSWNYMYIEEKEHLVRVLNETFNFPEFEDASAAAAAVRQDYENNPSDYWDGTAVDLDGFEKEISEIIENEYFSGDY